MCPKKLRNLRTQLDAEIIAKEMPPSGSERPERKAKKWDFYESLLFMKDTIQPGK